MNHLKNEFTSNHYKITNWALQSHLSGVDSIHIAFVSRNNTSNNSEHTIYGIRQTQPKQLLAQANFNYNIGWGMVKNVAEILLNSEDGEYILMKNLIGPKQLVKLFRVKPAVVEEDDEN